MDTPQQLSASSLIGDAIINPAGEKLGDLKDIVLDTTRGQIVYAVMASGGVLGVGEKLFAVPWGALRIQGHNENLVLEADPDRLKNASGFDKDHWPVGPDAGFVERGRTFYS
ncbi:MAG TPA: PRC-barrel domain-containing protein [Rhodanobacteraceae bacterium]|nr:PRC-barrel domain-containing protein [Rhodanobacteraceae bacterium]